MENKDIRIKSFTSKGEVSNREILFRLFKECPIPENELLSNLTLFIIRQDLTSILFLNDLYKKIIDVHGVIMEFGVRWGRNLALFESLRGLYEPFNHNRKIIGFDTFEGFPSVHEKDGGSEIISKGSYSTTKNYENYLQQILECHEKESPIPHIKKNSLVKGDAVAQLENYLLNNPETIISFAYFDFDIYEPTKRCLELIKDHLTKGSVIGFDELNHHDFPGETIAVKEVFGLSKYRISRSPYSSMQSFIIIE